MCESLEISGFIQPQMLIAVNFALCGTLNDQFIAKAPNWLYIPSVKEILPGRKSYTPHYLRSQGVDPHNLPNHAE